MARVRTPQRHHQRAKARREQRKEDRRERHSKPETAIVRVAAPTEKPWELNQEQITILKNNVAKGASDSELQFCLTVARRYKLDPFKQQIWFVKRWDSSADNGQGGTGAYVWTPQVGINGLLFAAARDHKKEFGSVSLPEYGPMVTQEYTSGNKVLTFKAPEWAKVKVWKKGETEPTESIAYWEEYAPADLAKAPFWRKMPRRMIGKCATALAIRQAYPDLGGVYIPEEMQRMQEDYTQSGRQITDEIGFSPSGEPVTWEARNRNPQALIDAEVERQKRGEIPSTVNELRGQAPKSDPPEGAGTPTAVKQPTASPAPSSKGTIEVDWMNGITMPAILRGDVGDIATFNQEKFSLGRNDGWWVLLPNHAKAFIAFCKSEGYSVQETLPKSSGGSGHVLPEKPRKGAEGEETPAPTVVKGIIEQANPQEGKNPRVSVLFKVGKASHWMTVFDKKIFEPLMKGVKKEAEIIIEKREKGDQVYTNIIGLKRVGNQEFDEDGKTPILQNRNREAGGKTLFP